MKIVCFGDSNTYGYDPRSWLGGRYDVDSRWVDILGKRRDQMEEIRLLGRQISGMWTSTASASERPW